MKLSSLDIRKQEFTRVVRGYDKEEVDAFLQLAANQWQEIIDDLRREEEKVKELNVKLEHYQKVEEALEEALKTARDGAKQTIENAEHKARLIIEEAESRSIGITKEAENERLSIRKDATKYSVRQKEIVAKLRAFLMSELEILAQYESEAPVSYIKLKRAEIAELVEDSSHELDVDAQEEEDFADYAAPEIDLDAAAPPAQSHDSDSDEEYVTESVAVPEEDSAASDEAPLPSRSDDPEPSAEDAASSDLSADEEEPEVSDEIDKIRRILEDLEK